MVEYEYDLKPFVIGRVPLSFFRFQRAWHIRGSQLNFRLMPTTPLPTAHMAHIKDFKGIRLSVAFFVMSKYTFLLHTELFNYFWKFLKTFTQIIKNDLIAATHLLVLTISSITVTVLAMLAITFVH